MSVNLLFLIALIFLGLAAFKVSDFPHFSWAWAGMFLWLFGAMAGATIVIHL